MTPFTSPAKNPQLYKGIALLTPGGDLIYCIDPSKQGRWHLHLCASLQEILGLPEPPHFLVPCYTATIDHWLDHRTQKIHTFAEAYPPILPYQSLLNMIFETDNISWQPAPWQEGVCDPIVLSTYRSTFAALWENHNLVVKVNIAEPPVNPESSLVVSPRTELSSQGYVLRLFIAGHTLHTERILQTLHELLEKHLSHPYTLKVIDVLTHPDQAEISQVSATPTLVKVFPPPVRRIIGNLESVERILQILQVDGVRET